MPPLIQEIATPLGPEELASRLAGQPGLVLLQSALFDPAQGRMSLVTARPFLAFRSFGSRCEWRAGSRCWRQFGDPWRALEALLARYELSRQPDLPFPLGGCFGWWGYELKNFVEPRLPRVPAGDLDLPDCDLGFHDSLVAFDHALGKAWVISTGLEADGSVSAAQARRQMDFWKAQLDSAGLETDPDAASHPRAPGAPLRARSNFTRDGYLRAVERAQRYIRAGDIYQVNLAQRLAAPWSGCGWDFHRRLTAASPAPFGAFLQGGPWQLSSASPELFLRFSGAQVRTRPIKGTRPRAADPDADARLACELLTSPKEMAELVMITDLLRNDLGRVCEYGSVRVPELVRLERFAQVQHLVSTVEGQLRPGVSQLGALAACFPGGSITGAPKIRAMEIISELEPQARGPYTGCLGFLGFNGESQLSIVIRAAILTRGRSFCHAGAGIVADSDPAAEYEETLAKAGGWFAALRAGGLARGPLTAAELSATFDDSRAAESP